MTEEQLHIVQEINTSDLCSIISSRNSSLEDEIRRLKNENKLLGERCNQLLTDKGKLIDENAELKEINEGYCRNRGRLISIGFPNFKDCKEYAEHLTKAKEIIKILLQYDRGQFFGNRSIYEKYMRTRDEAEQFLNSELQSKWINPARTTNDNEIKLNSEVEK